MDDLKPAAWFNRPNDYHGYQQVAEQYEGDADTIPLYSKDAIDGLQTALRAAAEREKELTQALGQCQKTLAMMTLPEAIQNSSVTNAWAACVAAETRARTVLSKHEKPAAS